MQPGSQELVPNNNNNNKVYKYLLLSALSLIVFVSLFLFIFLNKTSTPKTKASEMADRVYYICPTGTPGQNDCDYIGGDGIQQAIHDHITLPILSTTPPPTTTPIIGQYNIRISLKPGLYTPSRGILSEGKNIILTSNPANQATISANFIQPIIEVNGLSQVLIQDLKILKSGTNPVNAGITVKDIARLSLQHSDISGNQYGVEIAGGARAIISGSNIHNNIVGIRNVSTAQVVIHNSLIVNNSQYGVFSDPPSGNGQIHSFDLANNTLINNGTQATDSQIELGLLSNFNMVNTIVASGRGLGIHRPTDAGAAHFQGSLYLSHNDVYQHVLHSGIVSNYVAGDLYLALPDVAHWRVNSTAANLDGNKSVVTTFGTEYRLANGSPLIHAGASTVKNPDNSISDMGAYGGSDACDLDKTIVGCSLH